MSRLLRMEGTAQYIATGDLDASYNFSNRNGGVAISNFDNNVNLTGTLGETDSLNSALVGGGTERRQRLYIRRQSR